MFQMLATQFNQGGPFMWAILMVFVCAMAVVIERCIYYFIYCASNSRQIITTMEGIIDGKENVEMVTLLEKRNAPIFVLLRVAVQRYLAGASIEKIREGIEESSIKELPKITRRINYLALFANIATLVGLLGTITGLQTSFGSLATADAAQKAVMLSAGISQAMNTTAFGLIVAVPCMVLFTLLNNKQQAIVSDIDNAVVRIVNIMKSVRA